MPVRVSLGTEGYSLLKPTEEWQTASLPAANVQIRVDENFYVDVRNALAPAKP